VEAACTQQSAYVSCGFSVAVKFSFLNFVSHSWTRRGFELPQPPYARVVVGKPLDRLSNMLSKKIRGLKRRQRDIDSWTKFHKSIDMDRLKQNGYVYAKAKVGPWANLFNDRPYPADFRRQLLTNLIDFYFNWRHALDLEFDKYYLKLWVQYPRFIDSQLIAAVGDRIDHYDKFEQIEVEHREFPVREFQNEKERIIKFNWQVYSDIDTYWESEFTQTKLEDFHSPEDYFANQRLFNKLIRDNTPSRLITDEEGNSQRLFYKRKGLLWIGELK
jgi:hypothetical protein